MNVGCSILHIMTKKELSKGDHVSWNTSQGKTYGIITRKVTEPTSVRGHSARASKREPQYEVQSVSGKRAIHKLNALTLQA